MAQWKNPSTWVLPVMVLAMFAAFFARDKQQSKSQAPARYCYVRNMLPLGNETQLFCVEPDTGITHFYPRPRAMDQ